MLAAGTYPGFLRRSVDELKKISVSGRWKENLARGVAAYALPGPAKLSIEQYLTNTVAAIRLEGLSGPKDSLAIWNFSDPKAVSNCVDMSDGDIGGFSRAQLTHVAASNGEPAHAHFTGHISNRLPSLDQNVERTGYAAWRTKNRPGTIFGSALWDVEHYKYLALRIKSDGRKYKVNIQTDCLEPTDIHQHRLYARDPGRWETVLIKWSDFVRTNHGIIVEPQSEMLRDSLRTIGVGLTDRLAGPFEFRISRIWATNALTSDETQEAAAREPEFIPKEIRLPKQVGPETGNARTNMQL